MYEQVGPWRKEAMPIKPEEQKANEDIGKFGMWVNDNIVGNPITFVLCILSVFAVYAAIPLVGGYNKWNTGLGLFFNTLSSSFELITGVGAVVGVVVLHKKGGDEIKAVRAHEAKVDAFHAGVQNDLVELHSKVNKLLDVKGETEAVRTNKEA